jgi:PAS domain-containing protein
MQLDDNEERLLRSVALQNAKAVLLARERAERELLHANQRITNILESITDGFIALDKQWRFIFINGRAQEILRPLNKAKESLLGVSHWEVFSNTMGTEFD